MQRSRVDHDDDDAIVQGVRAAAFEWVQSYCQVFFGTQTITAYLDGYYNGRLMVGQIDSNRKRSQDSLEQVEGRLRQLLDDSSIRKELREIARKEAGKADEQLMLEVAQKAIRQALASGVIPKQLQPKPMRPQPGGD